MRLMAAVLFAFAPFGTTGDSCSLRHLPPRNTCSFERT
jgi:hypothetical protein